MGLHFGDLAIIRGVVYYKLMPHELKPFAKAITEGLPNMIPRFTSRALTWVPPLGLGAFTWIYIDYAYWLSKRKNPRDYVNEVDPNPPAEEVEDKKEKCKKKKKGSKE